MKKNISTTILKSAAAVALATGLLTSNAAVTFAADTVKIGVAAPLSGTEASYGESFKNGTALAVKEYNESIGDSDAKVEINLQDDQGNSQVAVNIANQFASDSSVIGVVGNFNSSATLASAPIYNMKKLVTVSPSSSAPTITDAGEYVYRVITTDAFQASYVADWSKELGYEKVALLYEQSDFGQGLLNVYKERAEEIGLEIVLDEAYTTGQTTDFSTILTKVKAADPDAVFIGGFYNEAALITQQAARLGIETNYIGVDSLFSNALLEQGGESVEGFHLIGFYNPEGDNEVAASFDKAYQDEYGSAPDSYAAYAYDAAGVLLDAVKNGATDRDAVKAYLDTLKDYAGATGTFSFDENGDVETTPSKLVVENNKFTVVE